MKEIVLWKQWEQMCCIGSCVLCKHTQYGGPKRELIYIAMQLGRVEVPKSKPEFDHLCSEHTRNAKGKEGRRKGLFQLQHDMVTVIAGPCLRIFWLFPQGNSLYLSVGGCAHASAHV